MKGVFPRHHVGLSSAARVTRSRTSHTHDTLGTCATRVLPSSFPINHALCARRPFPKASPPDPFESFIRDRSDRPAVVSSESHRLSVSMVDVEMIEGTASVSPVAPTGTVDAEQTQVPGGKTFVPTRNTGDGVAPNDDALAFAKRKASLGHNKRAASSAAAKRRAAVSGADGDDERDGGDDDVIDEKDASDDDADDDADDNGDDAKEKTSAAPKKHLKTLKGDSSFIHYGGDCYVQSTQRPGGGTYDLVFQLYDENAEYYPFANTDARGLYAPGKEAALLRSKGS